MDRDPEFEKLILDARRRYVGRMALDVDEIADDGTNDYVEREVKGGKLVIQPDLEHIARSKLRIDTRKWLLAKVYPKLYGDQPQGVVDPVEQGRQLRDALRAMLQQSDMAEPPKGDGGAGSSS